MYINRVSLKTHLKTSIRLKYHVDKLEIERGKDGRRKKEVRSRMPPAVSHVNWRLWGERVVRVHQSTETFCAPYFCICLDFSWQFATQLLPRSLLQCILVAICLGPA